MSEHRELTLQELEANADIGLPLAADNLHA